MNKMPELRIIKRFDCCDGVGFHAPWCKDEKTQHLFEIGDRVKSPKNLDIIPSGIIIQKSYVKNEEGIYPRYLIFVKERKKGDREHWVVEGNLKLVQ